MYDFSVFVFFPKKSQVKYSVNLQRKENDVISKQSYRRMMWSASDN